ncbi:MAG: heparinase II/III family protein [Marinilabiliaceae bacterium]|nr:heparinase II/III family protein [Marinilabiliaceae bacterium]
MKRTFFCVVFLFQLLFSMLWAQNDRRLLIDEYNRLKADGTTIPMKHWLPMGVNFQNDHAEVPLKVIKAFINEAETYLEKPHKTLHLSLYREYVQNGNRTNYQNIYFERRRRLAVMVVAEWLEQKGRFINDIADGVWGICEESTWAVPAHLRKPDGVPVIKKPILDLFASETASLLAWTYVLMEEQLNTISPDILTRIKDETKFRVIDEYLENNSYWWLGLSRKRTVNNWNPWINSNVLIATLFLETDTLKKEQIIEKTIKSVDVFIDGYADDGGCDEGPAYWDHATGALFDYLEVLHHASCGKFSIFEEPVIKQMALFFQRTWIGGNYFVNFSDAGAIIKPNPVLLYEIGQKIDNEAMQQLANYFYDLESKEFIEMPKYGSLGRVFSSFKTIHHLDSMSKKSVVPVVESIYLSDLQLTIMRSSSEPEKGLFVSVLGAHNGQSHNHNDVGNFTIYYNGKPLIIDVGVGEYTAKTFNSKRYEIWAMQSQYHNVPTINGVQQKEGKEFKATDFKFRKNSSGTYASLNLETAYPTEAAVKEWKRQVSLSKSGKVTILEKYQLTKQLERSSLNLMTAFEPKMIKYGVIELGNSNDKQKLAFDPKKLNAKIEKIDITDRNLKAVWGNAVYRLVFEVITTDLQGELKLEITK